MLSLRNSPIPIRQIDCILLVYKRGVAAFPTTEIHKQFYSKLPAKNKPLTEKQVQKILDSCEASVPEGIYETELEDGELLGEKLRREAYEGANRWRMAVKNLQENKDKCLAGHMDACHLCNSVMRHEEAWHFKLEKNIILAEERGDLQRLAELRTRVYPELPL